MKKKLLYLICALCSACSSRPHPKMNDDENSSYQAESLLNTERQLKDAATSIEKSLEVLASLQENNNPVLLNTAPLVTAEGGMGKQANIDWLGPIEQLMYKVAEMTNYRVKILGAEPPIPIIVSITQQNVVIADILKNASLQIGNKAQIVVFPSNKIIELRYKTF